MLLHDDIRRCLVFPSRLRRSPAASRAVGSESTNSGDDTGSLGRASLSETTAISGGVKTMSAEPGVERRDVVVVGAGQAGLAVSWYLRLFGVDHVVMERGGVG